LLWSWHRTSTLTHRAFSQQKVSRRSRKRCSVLLDASSFDLFATGNWCTCHWESETERPGLKTSRKSASNSKDVSGEKGRRTAGSWLRDFCSSFNFRLHVSLHGKRPKCASR